MLYGISAPLLLLSTFVWAGLRRFRDWRASYARVGGASPSLESARLSSARRGVAAAAPLPGDGAETLGGHGAAASGSAALETGMTSLRAFTCNDLFRFNNINLDPLTETYGIPFYLQYLAHWPEYFIVAEAPGGELMGYIMGKAEGSVAREEWHGHVTALSVAPEFRRLGLAAKLMELLEEISERKGGFFVDLFVRVSNQVAVNMYKQLGYSVYRTVLEYYSASSGEPDEDAYDMRKALSRDKEKKSIIPQFGEGEGEAGPQPEGPPGEGRGGGGEVLLGTPDAGHCSAERTLTNWREVSEGPQEREGPGNGSFEEKGKDLGNKRSTPCWIKPPTMSKDEEKVNLRRLEPAIQKFIKVAIPTDLERLRKHQINIEKYQRCRLWDKLHEEHINAGRTVQQLRANIREMENLCSRVRKEDTLTLQRMIDPVKVDASLAVQEFLQLHSESAEVLKRQFIEQESASSAALTCSTTIGAETSSNAEDGENSLSQIFAPLPEIPQDQNAAESWEVLEEDLIELSTLVTEFSLLVNTQQEKVDRIEENVCNAVANVEEGTRNLSKAATYKLAALPVAGALLGGIVGGPIGLLAGFKVAGLAAALGGGVLGFTGGKLIQRKKQKMIKDLSSASCPDLPRPSDQGGS
ncbi:syntaxin-17 [Crotalus adamanteus]|uniref:N-alpha-acetyltransferase 20 n=1 Tax=Crotalus adamanteus TaxID=8729 RepID=A0AAW1BM59_CROAD